MIWGWEAAEHKTSSGPTLRRSSHPGPITVTGGGGGMLSDSETGPVSHSKFGPGVGIICLRASSEHMKYVCWAVGAFPKGRKVMRSEVGEKECCQHLTVVGYSVVNISV